MANKIILPAQVMSVKELVDSLPGKIKKVFFQTELISISNNDVIARIIAYAARKNQHQRWELGRKVVAAVDDTKSEKSFSLPIAVGNCEWVNTNVRNKRPKEPNSIYSERKAQAKAIKKIHRLTKNEDLIKTATLRFSARKSSNPHLEYSVTLDSGLGRPETAMANPSPPATPAE